VHPFGKRRTARGRNRRGLGLGRADVEPPGFMERSKCVTNGLQLKNNARFSLREGLTASLKERNGF
jgi:hypothetical protein